MHKHTVASGEEPELQPASELPGTRPAITSVVGGVGRALTRAYWLEEGCVHLPGKGHTSVTHYTSRVNSYPLPDLIPTRSLWTAVISFFLS